MGRFGSQTQAIKERYGPSSRGQAGEIAASAAKKVATATAAPVATPSTPPSTALMRDPIVDPDGNEVEVIGPA